VGFEGGENLLQNGILHLIVLKPKLSYPSKIEL